MRQVIHLLFSLFLFLHLVALLVTITLQAGCEFEWSV